MQATGANERKTVMSRPLPIRPDLEHLKNEAKRLQKAHLQSEASARQALRHLKRLARADDAQLLSASVTLTEAQFALALDYGFRNWDELRKAVLVSRPLPSSDVAPSPRALRIPDPPAGKGGNRLVRAYEMALNYCGVSCEYDTVAGDCGLAFILQADSKHTPYGADVKELDLGWWPLDEWGAMLQLDFLARAYGLALRRLPLNKDAYRADAAEHFRRQHQGAIVEAFQAERPIVAVEHGAWLVTGMDDGTPPLLGQLACEELACVKRTGLFPWTVVVPGEMSEPMDRVRADAEAIAFAVSLHHDRFGESSSGCPLEDSRNKSSGKASFALWAAVLRDGERCGPAHYSANVLRSLKQNRRSVPPYLRQMATRHGSAVAHSLQTAAEIYESALAKLDTANTSKEAFANTNGRTALAALLDDVSITEAKAVGELQAATQWMKK